CDRCPPCTRPWREAQSRRARGECAAPRARPAQRGWELPDRAALRRRSGVHEEAGRATGTRHPIRDELRREQALSDGARRTRCRPIVSVLFSPGPGGQRTIEYDTVSDRYVNFVETEVLPRITRDYQVAFTTDPEGRAAFGESSGAAAALTMAWLHPNLYRRVISYSGTFVALQRNVTAPNGAWDFHQTFIPNSERKALRIWLHVSENDLGAT